MNILCQQLQNLLESSEPEHPGTGSPPFLFGQIKEPMQSESTSQSPAHWGQGVVGEQLSVFESTG
jgi:hypothetical protein